MSAPRRRLSRRHRVRCRAKLFLSEKLFLATVFALCICAMLLPSPPVWAAEPVEVVVTGLEDEALENVEAALTLPPGLVRDGEVNRPWLDLFVNDAEKKVREALEPFGYYDPNVAVSLSSRSKGEYRLTVDVKPGIPVRIASITIGARGPGAEHDAIQEEIGYFTLGEGDVLLHRDYEEGKGLILAKAFELGYLDADFSVHEIRVSRARHSADIVLELDTGPRYRFGETTFIGAPQYPVPFLSRYLDYEKGKVFSQEKLAQTQANLAVSDRFAGVIAVPDKEAAVNSTIPVQIQLKPLPRRRLRPGIGYGTDTGFRGSVRYKDVNMFLRGHELNSEINLSQRLQGVAFSYTVPSSHNINSATALQANFQREDTDTYINRLISLEGSWSRSFLRGQRLRLYLKTQQEDYTIGEQHDSAFLLLPGLSFSLRHFDSTIRPTLGYRLALDFRGTHQYFGSSTGLLQCIVEGHGIVPLPWRFSLKGTAKAGYTLQNEPLKELPASLRFFAGGDRSVRGYGYQELGPRDSSGDVVGGKNLLTMSVELEKALFTNWGLAVFYDAGNAFDSLSDIRLYEGAGVGVRYYTPIGALQLDLARQIGVEDPSYRVHFTVGFEL